MKKLLRILVTVTASLSMVACTSLKVVADTKSVSTSLGDQIKASTLSAGDTVHVYSKNGESVELKVITLNQDELSGVVSSTTTFKSISLKDVERLDRVETDAGKTILLVGGVILGIVLIANLAARQVADAFTSIGSK